MITWLLLKMAVLRPELNTFRLPWIGPLVAGSLATAVTHTSTGFAFAVPSFRRATNRL